MNSLQINRLIMRISYFVRKHASGLMIILVLSGCASVGPDYIRPGSLLPSRWNTESGCNSAAVRLHTGLMARWWSTFSDPELTDLIERAIRGNTDLRKAVARIREARARQGISRAALFPSVTGSGSVQHTQAGSQTGVIAVPYQYSLGLDATWDPDIFGGKRRSVEAYQADLDASVEDMRDVLVTLVSDVASSYLDVRSYQTRLSIAEANRDSQQETYQITEWRFEAGLTTALDVEQARYNLDQTRAEIPTLQTSLEEAKNGIAVLLGLNPGSLQGELAERKPIPLASSEIAIGVPADVLRNRPDVRRTERKLAAQTARIGVAVADLYPNLTLTGTIGLEAISPGKLFSSGSRTSGYSPGLSWTIFDAGSIRQNIEVQNALQEQALIEYEASILSALKEVNNALVAYAQEQVRRQSLIEASQAAKRAVAIAENQYSSGLIDFTVLLDDQRSLLTLQDSLAQSEAAVMSDLITLYKTLGGGWESETPGENK